MTNLLIQDPVYISLEDFRETTKNSSLKSSLSVCDDDLKWIIYSVQKIIDDYIWHYETAFDEDQEFIFPIDVYDVSTVPTDIAIAAVYIGEVFFENQTATSSDNIKSVKSWPRTVEYFEGWSDLWVYINEKAQTILDNYKNEFYYQTV